MQDINSALTKDVRISEIFYYFSEHTDLKTGRTVGRKIGVIQEILIKKFLLTHEKLKDSIIYEPKLRGKSGATHKVEFVAFNPIAVVELPLNTKLRLISPSLELSLKTINVAQKTIKLVCLANGEKITKQLKLDHSFGLELVFNHQSNPLFIKLVQLNAQECRLSILNALQPVASVESKRVGAQRFSGSDKLGSGIQTIEKAKQTALVAVDFDLQFNDELLVHAHEKQRAFKSFALLGNGVHWTDHDLSVLETFVDFTFQVKDEAILRYADYVKNLALKHKQPFFEFFMTYFSGMTIMPEDDFIVTKKDFLQLRPLGEAKNKTLVELVAHQIADYPILKGD
jgi:hypothetical protein